MQALAKRNAEMNYKDLDLDGCRPEKRMKTSIHFLNLNLSVYYANLGLLIGRHSEKLKSIESTSKVKTVSRVLLVTWFLIYY